MTPKAVPSLVAIVLVVAGGASLAAAYPISPQPLWQLVRKADRVVYAEVVRVDHPEPSRSGEAQDDGAGPPSVAHLRVVETWKGRHDDELRVEFHPDILCPAPPRYVEGERTVAFLAPRKGRLITVGLSYGTLYPVGGEVEDLRLMTALAVDLQVRSPVPEALRVEWAVEAASRKGTRWHGLYTLHPRGDAMHAFYDRDRRDLARARLSAEQIGRIARGFVAAPSADVTVPMVLAVAHGREDPALDLAVLSVVEAVLERDRLPYWLGDALALVLLRFGDASPEARLAPFCGAGLCTPTPEDARRLWEQARSELAIPTAEPLERSEPPVARVGPRTPS